MSNLILPSHGLFFGSALWNDDCLSVNEIRKIWTERFGESVEFSHSYFPMKNYYSKQMGQVHKLKRILFASLQSSPREIIVDHKIWANDLEQKLMLNFNRELRPLNLDIGLLTLENVVLATGKSFAHRIYLGRGVYADLNLEFEHKSMKPLSWTYPDYSHPDFIEFFNWLRGFLLRKNAGKNT
jgi:hypothetical protein